MAEPKQEKLNQVLKELVAQMEARTWAIREEMRVQAAARRNTALVWLVEQSLAIPRRVETVLQVPPPAALVVEPTTTYTPMGMGGQSGAVEKATRAHRQCTKILSDVTFCYFI
jgi:hypothetical protein